MAFSRSHRLISASSTRPISAAAIEPLLGRYPVLARMQRLGIPLTRESYLNVVYMGDPPKQLGAEEEGELPPPFRGQ